MNQLPWYSHWFTQEYLQLYAHRDEDEANETIRFLLPFLPLRASLNVLDVASGTGRHMIALAKTHPDDIEVRMIGIDLSPAMLVFAQKQIESQLADVVPAPALVRADMRLLPFPRNSFDVLLSMFTSFGYFRNDLEHLKMLSLWNALLKPSSLLVLDYLNKNFVLDSLESLSTQETKTKIIKQIRYVTPDASRVVKNIIIHNKESGDQEEFKESVRMYTREELQRMIEETGFKVRGVFGNFQGESFRPDSERLIMVAYSGERRS